MTNTEFELFLSDFAAWRLSRAHKPRALKCRWNKKDLSVSIYAGGKVVHKCKFYGWNDVRKDAQSFIDGWFANKPHKVRWVYK